MCTAQHVNFKRRTSADGLVVVTDRNGSTVVRLEQVGFVPRELSILQLERVRSSVVGQASAGHEVTGSSPVWPIKISHSFFWMFKTLHASFTLGRGALMSNTPSVSKVIFPRPFIVRILISEVRGLKCDFHEVEVLVSGLRWPVCVSFRSVCSSHNKACLEEECSESLVGRAGVLSKENV